jgi:hypothetical protein
MMYGIALVLFAGLPVAAHAGTWRCPAIDNPNAHFPMGYVTEHPKLQKAIKKCWNVKPACAWWRGIDRIDPKED